jgi:hypothetical protein
MERAHLLVGDHAAGVGVDDPADLVVGQFVAVALGDDDVDGIEGFSHRPIMSGPAADGPDTPSSREQIRARMPGAICSLSTGMGAAATRWRQVRWARCSGRTPAAGSRSIGSTRAGS